MRFVHGCHSLCKKKNLGVVTKYTSNRTISRSFSISIPILSSNNSLYDLLKKHYQIQHKKEFIEQDWEMLRNNRICSLHDWNLLSEIRKAKYPDALATFLDAECENLYGGVSSQQRQEQPTSNDTLKRLIIEQMESRSRTLKQIESLIVLIDEIRDRAETMAKEVQSDKQKLNDMLKGAGISIDSINAMNRNNDIGKIKVQSKVRSNNCSYKLKKSLGSYGSARGELYHPYGVVTDSQGNIIVTDKGNHRIQVFDSEGNFLRTFGSQGHGDGELYYPQGLAIDKNDDIYICDFRNHRIQVFDTFGRLIRKFGTQGSGEGQLILPSDVAVDSKGTVFVCDYFNNRVQKFGSDGQFVGQIDTGEETKPCTISIRQNGNIIVSDRESHKLIEYDKDGQRVGTIGSEGSGDTQFLNPEGITIDQTNNLIYVCDADNHRIQILDNDNRCVGKIGSQDDKDTLHFPIRICLNNRNGDMLVADMFQHKIHIFSME